MPMSTPTSAAAAVPASSASVRVSQPGRTSLQHTERNAPVKAPTLIKPAWPRLSSPKMPTVRFSETAMIT